MKIRFGLVLALAVGLGLGGCASSGGGSSSSGGGLDAILAAGGGDAGESPRDTDNTRAAEDALEAAEDAGDPAQAETFYRQALSSAQAGITEDPTNPLAYRLAGEAALWLEDYQAAGEYFDEAIELRPLYEFDLVSVREQAWIDLYQEATPYIQSGDYVTAAEYFEDADAIYKGRPEATITLAQIYAQQREHELALEKIDAAMAFADSEAMAAVDSATAAGWQEQLAELPMLRAQVLADAGRYEEAVGTYRDMVAANPDDIELKRGLAAILMEMGNEEEAFAIYDEMLAMGGLEPQTLFSIGVGFYQGSDYGRAAEAFGQAAEASVNDRDAIEMWARSLQLDSAYTEVPPVAERWIELDPNGRNAYLILAQAANQAGDQATTQEAVQAVEALEVAVNDLTLSRFPNGGASVSGSVVNATLDEGSPVTLTFTFYDSAGTPLGTVSETVSVGAADMAEVFQIQFDSTEHVDGYGYELSVG